MGANLARVGNFGASKIYPHPARPAGYCEKMPAPLPAIVAANVLALLRKQHPDMRSHETGITRLLQAGMTQGSAQRILKGETKLNLGTLEEVAKALRVPVWQLLVPDLDANAPPGLTAAQSWPFEMVPAEAYWSLPAEDRIFLQGRFLQWLEAAAARHAASPSRRLGNGR